MRNVYGTHHSELLTAFSTIVNRADVRHLELDGCLGGSGILVLFIFIVLEVRFVALPLFGSVGLSFGLRFLFSKVGFSLLLLFVRSLSIGIVQIVRRVA